MFVFSVVYYVLILNTLSFFLFCLQLASRFLFCIFLFLIHAKTFYLYSFYSYLCTYILQVVYFLFFCLFMKRDLQRQICCLPKVNDLWHNLLVNDLSQRTRFFSSLTPPPLLPNKKLLCIIYCTAKCIHIIKNYQRL